MKKNVFILLLMILLVSCEGKKKAKNTEANTPEVSQTDVDESATKEVEKKEGTQKEGGNQIDVDTEALKEKIPVSNEELKEFFPDNLIGYKLGKITLGNEDMDGSVSMVNAEYKNEQGNDILLSVIDGAGEVGSALVYMTRLSSEDYKEDTVRGYKKTEEVNGYHTKQEVEKYKDRTSGKLSSLIDNRFLITLDSNNNTLEEIVKAFKALDFKELEDLD